MATRKAPRRIPAQGGATFMPSTQKVPRRTPSGPSSVPGSANAKAAGGPVPRARGPLAVGDGVLGAMTGRQRLTNGEAAALAELRTKLR